MIVTTEEFGLTREKEPVKRFRIENSHGTSFSLLSFGAIISSVQMTPKSGAQPVELTLGYTSVEEYENNLPYFGATVGRVANRIAGGRFELHGAPYQLECNAPGNHIHGGYIGFGRRMWDAELQAASEEAGVRLRRVSPDGEDRYPGKVEVELTVTLNESNELRFEYRATADRATPINLTNHCYWNLAGSTSENIREHEVRLFSDAYLPVNERQVPTGELKPVKGTAFDFTSTRRVGERMEALDGGIDHCYQVRGEQGELRPAAQVVDPASGRRMEIHTTTAGLQFYTGNLLAGEHERGNGGRTLPAHAALCLEAQGFPDAVNRPEFPSIILEPGAEYRQTTLHRFRQAPTR
ncbi:MAG: galactose mutarotase [Spirochaetaceae bacterium]|nr:MAG: galactose mutarotase [Spirochaetaceae bacterium]